VVVPGLAFDRRGGRLGYGGGNYDKFLRRLPADAVLIGLAFSEQIVQRSLWGRTTSASTSSSPTKRSSDVKMTA